MGFNPFSYVLDVLKKVLVTIDNTHAEIHNGNSFRVCITTQQLATNPLRVSLTNLPSEVIPHLLKIKKLIKKKAIIIHQ